MHLRAALVSLASLASLAAVVACSRSNAPSAGASPDVAVAPPPPVRPPAEVRQAGNHLLGAHSIYLAQHAHNPVEWYPWGPEALARARNENKPIFLSIGYSSCHWCHVMEDEVFEKDDVATVLNEHFIAIKVDREERPDLDEAYMRALQSMSGSGGWPMSLFLTPKLVPFFGATYLPHDRFVAVASEAWKELASKREDTEKRAAAIAERLSKVDHAGAAAAVMIGADDVHTIVLGAVDSFDTEAGGFRGQQKFPVPVRWSLLLHAVRKWGDAPIESGVRLTLDAMARGGIRDPIGGGFHRYSTDPRWDVPHFEKMLYDNAQLASLYTEAGVALREPAYTAVATDTLDFLLRDMQAPDGGFYASFDADSGGKEGAFYVFTPADVRAAVGAGDADVAIKLLGVGSAGALDGASVVNRRASFADVAEATKRTPADVEALWKRARLQLFAYRAHRVAPRLDTKVVTAWNGLAIAALAHGFEATGDVRYRDAALRAADYLWRVHRGAAGGLYRVSNQGQGSEAGVLEDYAFLADGLVALFDATGQVELVERALTLVGEADARFHAPSGGWFDGMDGATPFPRDVSLDDSVEPSGTAVMMRVRIALAALTLKQELLAPVDEALRLRADDLRRGGVGNAGWLDAALLRAGPYYDLVVSADGADGDGFVAAYRSLAAPWAVFARTPAAGPDPKLVAILGAAEGKVAGKAPARGFVCAQGTCKNPTADPVMARALLLEGWKR